MFFWEGQFSIPEKGRLYVPLTFGAARRGADCALRKLEHFNFALTARFPRLANSKTTHYKKKEEEKHFLTQNKNKEGSIFHSR